MRTIAVMQRDRCHLLLPMPHASASIGVTIPFVATDDASAAWQARANIRRNIPGVTGKS